MSDSIKLTVPRARPYQAVVRLVTGGLAARLHLSYEHLEDVRLALDTVLGNELYAAGEAVTLEVSVDGDVLDLAVGPLDAAALEADLAADESQGVGLRRLLSTVVGGVEVERRNGAEWLRMRKPLSPASAGAPV